MSTLKTNNIEHLDASSPSIQLDVGGGIVVAGVITATSMDLTSSDGFTVGTGASVSSPATNVLALGTNNTERVRISSTGNVGIGTDDPSNTSKLHIYDGSAGCDLTITSGNVNAVDINLGDIDDLDIGRIRYNNNNDSMTFDTNGDERLRITSDGDVNVAAGGSVFIANGNLVFSTSGTGIDFSATGEGSGTMTSELLDDYEEGTFTPHIYFGGSDTGAVYSGQTGNYVKVGRMVSVFVVISTSTKSSSTGAASLGGLPFTPSSSGLDGYSALATADVANITFTNPFSIRVVGGSNNATFIHSNGNGLTDTAFANNSQVIAFGSYLV